MKKFALVFSLVLGTIFGMLPSLSAEKLTTVAVIDLDRVYLAVNRDDKKVREFEQTKQSFQDELNTFAASLTKLKEQRAEALAKNDSAAAQRIDQDIAQKTQQISEYRRTKQAHLEDLKKNLNTPESVRQDLDDVITYIAISEGYTVVLLAGTDKNVYWYSSEVDITQKVIVRLKQMAKYQ